MTLQTLGRRRWKLDPSCVLYLPLYKLDGSSFMSRDHYGHLCTVTGALWTPQGRWFDGTNDKIAIAGHPALYITEAITIIIWHTPSAVSTDTKGLIHIGGVGSNAIALNVDQHETGSATGWVSAWFNDGVAWRGTAAAGMISAGVPHCFAWTYNRVKSTLYRDGDIVRVRDYTGTMVLPANPPSIIGCAMTDTQFINGVVGMVWVCNRALTPQEVQHNYLATKWRYQ